MEINKELIERYHLGLCNPQEIESVKAWLESDQVDMTFPEEEGFEEMVNSGWEKLRERYDLPIQPAMLHVDDPKIRRLGLNWQLVASVAILLGLSIGYLLFYSDGRSQQHFNTQLTYKKIQTKKGQKLQVTLPDGTQVWMNSESILRFPSEFRESQRKISFTGEGYFSVAKNPKKPFIITSKRIRIQVLGTRFNFRDYPLELLSSVIVEEGKVRFSALNSPGNLVLTANQKGTFTENSDQALKNQVVYNTGKYINWKDNKLVLDDMTLAEIGSVLERWYGVTLIIKDSKLSRSRYSGSFSNPSLKQVLESICFALKCNFQQQENIWIISK